MIFRTFHCAIAASVLFGLQGGVVTEMFSLPDQITEASALETTPRSKFLWTLQDSGNPAELLALDSHGKLAHTLKITNAQNVDWEALASDKAGNLYVGDFGNNDNKRRDLCIYKIKRRDLGKTQTAYAAKISFHYPDQTEFPPTKDGKFYDAEAFIYLRGHFYLFTKNRSGKSGTRVYSIPAKHGHHTAKLLGEIPTDDDKQCRVTDADISDDGKRLILISYRKAWLIDDFKRADFTSGKITEIQLETKTQLEGVCFKNNSTVYLVDEKIFGRGGKVYRMEL